MSLRNCFVLPIALLSVAFLIGCGGSGSPAPVPPPSGGFSTSNLNGTYVFSVSGTDVNGASVAMVGTFSANGSGNISGGTVDINDENSAEFPNGPIPNASISSSSYKVGVDGRGQVSLPTSTPFGTIVLDFVLQNSSHGLVTEFDNNATGSGTLDAQSAGVTPNGSYAFILSGVNTSSGDTFATVGNFTLSGTTISAGLEDFNSGGVPYPSQALSGQVVLGPSSTPATMLSTTSFALTFDVYAIDATHLKFIETDVSGTLSGDAYSQSTTTLPVGSLAFTLSGLLPGEEPIAAGGFMVTDSSGDITTSSTEDLNEGGTTISSSPVPFSGSYSASGTGRYVLDNFSGFAGGSEYAAYPSSGGVLLLEIDSSLAIEVGAAYGPQSTTTLSTPQGYGLNLTGENLDNSTAIEVDDIAEFTAYNGGTNCGTATGDTVIGLIDENSDPEGNGPTTGQVLCGNYTPPDTNGRGQIGTVTQNNTLNGGFLLNYYTVDGTTFPFIEMDSGQVSTGVFVQQNASASSAAASKSHMYIVRPLVKPHLRRSK
jgi:hypothetical protein